MSIFSVLPVETVISAGKYWMDHHAITLKTVNRLLRLDDILVWDEYDLFFLLKVNSVNV